VSALEQNCELSSRPGLRAESSAADGWDDADEALEPAFERFYREHYAFVWRSARRMLAGAGDDQIEDVIQDTWITAYRRFDSFTGQCRPTTWLFGIVRNVARNHGRGERRRLRRVNAFELHEREQPRESGSPTRLLGRSLLAGFLRSLDEDKRAVFVLAELEGLSGREIAEALHINSNTAHSRLRAARREFCTYFDLPHSREAIAVRTQPLREQPEQPPAQAPARSRTLLIAGIGKGVLVASGSGGMGLAVFGKLAAAVGALLVVGVGVIAVEHEAEREVPVAVAREVVSRDAGTVELAAAELPSESPDELVPIPVRAPATARARVADPDPHELVRQARKALVDGQADAALELLGQMPATSALRGERVATEIAALCRLDRSAEAKAVFANFASTEPNSPLLAPLDSACW
jgi:RNA polymerase sigma factor (sigma-70 family)